MMPPTTKIVTATFLNMNHSSDRTHLVVTPDVLHRSDHHHTRWLFMPTDSNGVTPIEFMNIDAKHVESLNPTTSSRFEPLRLISVFKEVMRYLFRAVDIVV